MPARLQIRTDGSWLAPAVNPHGPRASPDKFSFSLSLRPSPYLPSFTHGWPEKRLIGPWVHFYLSTADGCEREATEGRAHAICSVEHVFIVFTC